MALYRNNLTHQLGKVISRDTESTPRMSVVSKNGTTGAMNIALRTKNKMYMTELYEEVNRATTKIYTVTNLPNTVDL